MNETMLHVFLCEELNFVSAADYNLTKRQINKDMYFSINLHLSEEGKFYVFY